MPTNSSMPEPTASRRVLGTATSRNQCASRLTLCAQTLNTQRRGGSPGDHTHRRTLAPNDHKFEATRVARLSRFLSTAGRLDSANVGRSAAFFDLDRTVIAKASALAFGRPFYRDGLLKRRDVIKAGYAQLMFRFGATDEASMARTRDYLARLCRGWQVEQVRQIVREALEELIQPYIYAEAAQLIAEHRSAGRDVVLVSASGEEMVRPIGEMLGVDRVIATRMKVVDGRYTGEIDFYAAGPARRSGTRPRRGAGLRPRGVVRLLRLGDRRTTALHVGHPTAVNPDRGLRKMAAERRWPTLEFRHPVPLGVPPPRAPRGAGGRGGDRRRGRARHRHRLVRTAAPQPQRGLGRQPR